MIMNRFVVLLAFASVICSCSDDDDAGVTIEPARPLSEVLVEDEAEIQEYLSTHYYNYEEFDNPTDDFDYKIDLMEIPEGDTTNIRPLSEFVETIEVDVPSSHFFIEGEDETVAHKLYYVIAREGKGETLTVADSAFARYEGQLLSGDIFDNSRENSPQWFNLPTLQTPATSTFSGTPARGFAEGMKLFKGGLPPVDNSDGTYDVEDYGVGFVIFPSGLGYYNSTQSIIEAYSPMIFKMYLLAVENETDHDGDGKLSIDEDTNGDGYLYNDDADEDGLVDYLDSDTN
ncbi:hypothetical protein B0O79_0590 [Flavobacteriaceae bacterium MAR_2009_75]|nr:hypothetical protein B0O79_0590 [Flavobacteriaceae bacterium MAR_2009_75]